MLEICHKSGCSVEGKKFLPVIRNDTLNCNQLKTYNVQEIKTIILMWLQGM